MGAESNRPDRQGREQDLLLLESDAGKNRFCTWGVLKEEYWFAWTDHGASPTIQRYATFPPMHRGQVDFGPVRIDRIVPSRSGRYVAIIALFPNRANYEIGCWDVERASWMWRKPHNSSPFAFDHNEEKLVTLRWDELGVIRVVDGQDISQIQTGDAAFDAVVHPTRQEVLVNEKRRLVVYDLARAGFRTELFLGGIADRGDLMRSEYGQTPPAPDIGKMRAEALARTEQLYIQLAERGMDEARLKKMRDRDIRRSEERWKEMEARVAAGKYWMPDEAKIRASCIAFSQSGEWLLCGTTRGLLVYRWPDALETAEPAWSFPENAIDRGEFTGASVGLLDEDTRRDEFVFLSEDTKVRTLAIPSKKVNTVLELPSDDLILSMKLSRDGRCLAMVRWGEIIPDQRDCHRSWQIWDYEQLRERAVER